jgi:hypothetical protein
MEIYSIDLKLISITEYEKTLEKTKLHPGRIILKENLKANFKEIKNQGIKNLDELLKLLKNEKKLSKFSKTTNIDQNYLIILRREINGFVTKPINLKEFPNTDENDIKKLEKISIKNSKELFVKGISKADREVIAENSGVAYKNVLKLLKLSDLGRVNGVGPVFAVMLFDVNVDTLHRLTVINEKELYDRLQEINKNNKYTATKFTINDMRYCIGFSKLLPDSIEYDNDEK